MPWPGIAFKKETQLRQGSFCLLRKASTYVVLVMKPTHKKIEKIDQCIRNKPLQGGNLLLHYRNEQFLDDSNDKTSFLYIGV